MHWALVAGDAASCRLELLHLRLPPSASVAPEQSIDARHYSHAAENILNWAIHISSSRKQGTARSRSRFFSDDRAVTVSREEHEGGEGVAAAAAAGHQLRART